MEVPSMVQRSGNTLIVRSVVSGNQLFVDSGTGSLLKAGAVSITGSPQNDNSTMDAYRSRAISATVDFDDGPIGIDEIDAQTEAKDEGLPQCKIKRNYSCNSCTFFTQNPRHFLTHLRDSHGEKIVINECKLCLYASRHYQKLVRHMKMVHGSTEGIEEHSQARKRQLGRDLRKRKLDLEGGQQPMIPPSPQILNTVEKFEEPLQDEGPQNRLLKCSVCDFTTLYRAQLVEHEQEEHYKTKFFRCEKCSYVTHIKTRFSKHVKYHSMPMIKCVTCDFRTPYKWNLDRHMKNHGGSGPYKCAACNFTADIKQSLTVHEMNHHVPPVGHAAGISMARRKNKVGATDIPDELLSENGDISDSYNNNNNVDSFEEPYDKKFKMDEDDQPTDLSQKSAGDSKKSARPIPNLIPIQAANSALNLTKTFQDLNKMLQRGLNLSNKPSKSENLQSLFVENGEITVEKIDGPQLSPSSTSSSVTSKKKGSFFDQLKQNATLNKNESLICYCGHTSKCLSESIIHQKSCCRDELDKVSSPSPINLSVNSGSTRCQYCRHRCKSSVDLITHMKSCTDAATGTRHESIDSSSDSHEKNDFGSERTSPPQEKHPMENRVFVWNNLPTRMDADNIEEIDEDKPIDGSNKSTDYNSEDQKKDNSENSYYGVETAPGYGEVTKKMSPEEEAANSSLKKVYKCPHCSFWASTASRFHVHIVGHLNKKPFECSLCNYRSNWRWDITKHIRLKTIRDPNHKNAKVLMNDETGRRNYTKYNKYITLMKVTEEDGDPKLLKSGEMTPNQEASLSFLNDYKRDQEFGAGASNEAGPSKNLSPIDTSRMMQMAFFPGSLLGLATQPDQMKRSPPPLMKPEDIVTQNIEVKPDGTDKRTLFKCRKCNYRNANRDIVLSHVKIHYQEASLSLAANALSSLPEHLQAAVNSNPYMKNVIAAMCLSQQQQHLAMSENNPALLAQLPSGSQLNHHHIPSGLNLASSQTGSKLSPNSLIAAASSGLMTTAAAAGLQQQQPSSKILTNNNTAATSTTTINNNTNPIEHGEADEASSGVVTTTGTGVTGWRGPAPYRCGHCHQVSNWKHVIQRHCRLKHNGDIRIETIDRTSDKNMPVYYPLTSQPSQQQSSFSNSIVNQNSTTVPVSSTTYSGGAMNPTGTNSMIFSQEQSNPRQFGAAFMPQVIGADGYRDMLETEGSQGGSASLGRPRQQQCPLCPFVSESKSQMMYHNSLHKCKSEFYQCQLCEYTCSKKQLLGQHIKMAHEDNKMDHEAVVESNEQLGQAISFCPRCPARYIGSKDLNLHLKMHTANYSYRCGLCSYTALQEASLLSHSTVHSQSYDEKTFKLLKRFSEDVHYPRPKLIALTLNSNDRVWIVERNTQPDLEDSKPGLLKLLEKPKNDSKPSLLKQQLEMNGAAIGSSSNMSIEYPDDYSAKCCPHCPFETARSATELKLHLENHICVSGKKLPATCSHCDFSVIDERLLKEHVVLHFKSIKNNDVPFYTSYENLELNLVEEAGSGSNDGGGSDNEETGGGTSEKNMNCDRNESEGSPRREKLLFKSSDPALLNGLVHLDDHRKKGDAGDDTSPDNPIDVDNDGDEKQVVVATSGELLKVRSSGSSL